MYDCPYGNNSRYITYKEKVNIMIYVYSFSTVIIGKVILPKNTHSVFNLILLSTYLIRNALSNMFTKQALL